MQRYDDVITVLLLPQLRYGSFSFLRCVIYLLLRQLGLPSQCWWPRLFDLQTQMSGEIERRDRGVVHTTSPTISSVMRTSGSSV